MKSFLSRVTIKNINFRRKRSMSTPHNEANEFDFAKTVLMPGDPLRAKFIADSFLTDVKQVNGVRNMLAYTGYYKGKKVSVMGSGMGIPSIGIYSYELYAFYHVERIIRVGTCGSCQSDVDLYDVVIASGASTNSNWAVQYKLDGTMSAVASYAPLNEAVEACKKMGCKYHVGQVFSSDNFYDEDWKPWADMGMLAFEMESYGLYLTAAKFHKEALTILTVSDSLVTHKETTAEERMNSFTNMMEVALSCIKE